MLRSTVLVVKFCLYCCIIKVLVFSLLAISVAQNASASNAAKSLMKQIFKTDGYNSAVRPSRNNSEPINVLIDMAMQQIIHVDVKSEQMTVLYWQRMEWNDDYLRWDPEQYENLTEITIMPKYIWLPDIVVYNNVGQLNMKKDGVIPVLIEHTGTVKWQLPIIYVTTCTIHIRHFPYDAQVCSLKFGSWINTANAITLKNTRGTLDTGHFTINGEWIVLDTPVINNRVEYDGREYTDVFMEVYLLRRPLFYEKNLIIPTAMISLLATLTFLLPPESGEKIGLGITVFLALCVNSILVSEMMPSTSLETPILGQYCLMAITMVAVSLVMTVVVLNFHFPHSNALPPPKWMKTLFFTYFAPLVFLSRVKKDEESSGQPTRKDKETLQKRRQSVRQLSLSADYVAAAAAAENGTGDKLNNEVSEEACSQQPRLDDLEVKINDLIEKLVVEDSNANVVQEWQYITRIIDRMFAIIFFTVVSCLSIILIMKAKTVDPHSLKPEL